MFPISECLLKPRPSKLRLNSRSSKAIFIASSSSHASVGTSYSIEHDVPTLACEDEEAMKMALDDLEFNLSLDGRGLSKHSEMGNILDGREDGVLKVVSEHNSPIIVLVYGSNHSFGGKQSFPSYDYDRRTVPNKDNIYEWNQENPDKMFSLIEIR